MSISTPLKVGGIDVGSSSIKWAVYEAETLTEMASGRERYPAGIFNRDSVDVQKIFRLFRKYVHLLRSKGVSRIGLSCMAPVMILTGRHWETYSSFPYNTLIGSDHFTELVDFRFMEKTGNPLNVQMFPQKIRWMMKHSDHLLEKAVYITDLNGYLFSRLTSREGVKPVEDVSSALEWGLFDIRSRAWWNDIIDYLKIEDKLPELVTPEYASEYGGVDISIGTVDTLVSALGSVGISKKNAFAINGTTLCAGFVTNKQVRSQGLYNDIYFDGNYLVNGCNSQYSSIIDWAERLLDVKIDVNRVDISRKAPVFLPYLLGERCPLFSTSIRGGFFELDADTGKSDLVRSVVCSLAYLGADMMESLAAASEGKLKRAVAGGSLTKKNLATVISSLTGMEYEMLDYDPTTLGAVLIAMKAGGCIGRYPAGISRAGRNAKMIFSPTEPHKEQIAAYEKFRKLRDMLIQANSHD